MQIKAKKLRREGFVTGNVFGKNMEGSMPLKIEKKEAERILRTCNKGSQLILTVEGQKMPVLLKEIDYNAMKHEIVEMDFQALVKGEKVHSVAEVVLLNHEKVKSGVVELLLEEISYEALPENLIEKVEIDLDGKTAATQSEPNTKFTPLALALAMISRAKSNLSSSTIELPIFPP